ncbi:shikimate kinase [Paenibacillus athensensis]|uniref:Shikimate kinase n=1 Tax=Paenibacillus athensensis TaxID=1967502 RepID=A0A4Y8PTY6_9BACL|nr:shikimate kinase [Paenibacillus athensensis]MCD1257958.1 shikimate kinase [Paenibacillus athensensis]
MDNIVLIGFMGSGKSTVGRKLADRLGWTFTDTDARVEQEQGTTISELFRQRGEAEFRELESRVLEDVLAEGRQVVATGGGIVLAERNRLRMLEGGLVVALKAEAGEVIKRVSSDRSRPLLQGDVGERVRTLMEQRKHAYDFAHLSIDTSALSVEQVIGQILERLQYKL